MLEVYKPHTCSAAKRPSKRSALVYIEKALKAQKLCLYKSELRIKNVRTNEAIMYIYKALCYNSI